MRPGMNVLRVLTISVLFFSSFAATNVAPTKAELEAMYDKAFREFNANNYTQALKELDAIDARQPDLAESQNLRGVILMRQANYDQAEASLQKALATDPKFWNARFNLAEIPFLRKDWAEARKRFDSLLQGNAAELQGEATQLIQYKILLTYLLQGNGNMVDSILSKFELSPETPAASYSKAAIALQHKNEKEAKEILATSEKNFSPQLNKLFAESLYEVGWIQKPAGQTRAAIELTSESDQLAKAKALASEKYDQAEQALQQRDFTTARRLIDEADAANPNQPATINLRGEILLGQKDFDGAEMAFRQAAKLDPKMTEAQYNLAQIPFKKKEYAKARDAFEALFAATAGPGNDRNQTSQIIKFNIYLTLLLEGKDSRAQKVMEQFKFTGDTPALYYAQAAWEYKHNNAAKANDWIVSARKIYSPALNIVFANPFYDLGWLQTQAAPATASTEVAQAEAPPPTETSSESSGLTGAGEPAAQVNQSGAEKVPDTAPTTESSTADTSSQSAQNVVTKSESEPAAVPASSEKTETAVSASNSASEGTGDSRPREKEHSLSNRPAAVAQQNVVSSAATKVAAPAAKTTAVAPASVPPRSTRSPVLFVILLLAGFLLIAWVVISELRRRVSVSAYPAAPTAASGFGAIEQGATANQITAASRLAGGPPQISLQLKASEPSVRRAAVPFGKMNRPFGVGAVATGNGTTTEEIVPRDLDPIHEPEQVGETEFQPITGSATPSPLTDFQYVGDVTSASLPEVSEISPTPEWEFSPASTEAASTFEGTMPTSLETTSFVEPTTPFEAPVTFEMPTRTESATELPPFETSEFFETVGEPVTIPPSNFVESTDHAFDEELVAQDQQTPSQMPAASTEFFESVGEPVPIPSEILAESSIAPTAEIPAAQTEGVAEAEPIPYQVPSLSTESPMAEITQPEPEPRPTHVPIGATAGIGGIRQSVESPSFAPKVISTEPLAQQPTTPATMPETIQSTPIRTAPMTGGAPQPASGMHTAVQLTFSFEIASMQLTPSFKMGALQLKPTSKIVTMRLAPSQQPQPAMNLQVTFEISTVQLAGNAIGMIRLVPSQQQRPGVISSPAFSVAGLQLLSGAESGAVQITPSQQGQASVHVTGRFQIATVEFSPSFEIASIVLNATSKNVSVQLPGAGPSAVEGAPVFEITNVQLGGNGEISVMQLNSQGAAPKSA